MSHPLIRNIAPETVESLRRPAQSNGRSLQTEIRVILNKAALETHRTESSAVERVRALIKGHTFSDSAELIREDRERG
jgi:plasmid stability protein